MILNKIYIIIDNYLYKSKTASGSADVDMPDTILKFYYRNNHNRANWKSNEYSVNKELNRSTH